MYDTAMLSPAGMYADWNEARGAVQGCTGCAFASQFVAERPHVKARSRARQVLRRFVRAFAAMGLALDGAYPPSGRAR